MDFDLSAEIARIEAELQEDTQTRQLQQQQPPQQPPQQQQQQSPQPPASMFGFGQTLPQASQPQQQPPQPQQQSPATGSVFNVNASPFVPPQNADYMQQQQPQQMAMFPSNAPGSPGPYGGNSNSASASSANAHSFSKDTDSRSIFVGNLPKGADGGPTTTPEELAQFFADCGQILTCTVLKDRTTGELKGTAYLEFADYTAMGKAIDTKNNASFKGSALIVTHKRPNYKVGRGRGGRGGRGGGRGGADSLQALASFMSMLGAVGGYRGRGGGVGRGAGRGGRGGGAGKPPTAPPPGSFQPYQ